LGTPALNYFLAIAVIFLDLSQTKVSITQSKVRIPFKTWFYYLNIKRIKTIDNNRQIKSISSGMEVSIKFFVQERDNVVR
jgi:hypothetical protein